MVHCSYIARATSIRRGLSSVFAPSSAILNPRRGVSFLFGEPPKKLNSARVLFFAFHETGFTFQKTRSSEFRRCFDEYLATRPTETHVTPAVPGHTPFAAFHQFSLGIATHLPRCSRVFCQSAGCGHLPDPRTNPPPAISPAETVTGLRLRRSMRTDIVRVLSSSWADLCATTC